MGEEPNGKRIGRVMWFDPVRGFGFVVVENRRESLFVHVNDLVKSGITINPAKGQMVRCNVGHHNQDVTKECAVDIELVNVETNKAA